MEKWGREDYSLIDLQYSIAIIPKLNKLLKSFVWNA